MENEPEMATKSRTCVEIGSLVFALITWFLLFVACVGSVVGIVVELFHIVKNGVHPEWDSSYAVTGSLVATLTLSSISLAFSTLLCKGILNEKAHYIKMYLIYGAVVLLLIFASGVVTLLIFYASGDRSQTLTITAYSFATVCLVYATILGMIWATYRKYRREIQYKHIASF